MSSFGSILDTLRNPGVGLLLVVLASTFLVIHNRRQRSRAKLPPSPRGIPIFGNAFQLGRLPWFKMTEWADQLGPVYSLNLAGQQAIVLNTHKAAADVLDKRSAMCSDRPRMIMTSEILCGDLFFPFNRYGDKWKKLRRAANEGLNPRASDEYKPIQEREAVLLAEALMEDPAHWPEHISRATASGVLSVVYSVPPIKTPSDNIVIRINDFMHRIEQAARPGAFLVDIFPSLIYVPERFAKWKRDGNRAHAKDTEMFMEFWRDAKSRVNSGQCGPCLSTTLMHNKELSEKERAWLAGSMFGAGSSTTAASQHVFLLAMVLFPHVMRKAQAEIDTVVGRSRLPLFSDRPNLPYVRALVRETFRWRSLGPLGVPHYTTEDDVYDGYYIPKNAMVFFNQWAMHRDPAVFPDPDDFRPERYLDETGTKDYIPPYTHGEGHTTFGYGRRKCLGITIANNVLFMHIATILWAFNIGKAKDANGKEVTPDMNDFHDEGLVVIPAPFPCTFTPRSPEVVDIISSAKEAQGATFATAAAPTLAQSN